jgi:hypothetical protein
LFGGYGCAHLINSLENTSLSEFAQAIAGKSTDDYKNFLSKPGVYQTDNCV